MAWMVVVPVLAIALVLAGAVVMSLDSGKDAGATRGRPRRRRVAAESTGLVETAPVVEREFPASYLGQTSGEA